MTRAEFDKKFTDLIHKWIGVPFLHHGRAQSQGVDCLGLLVCVYKDLGIDIAGDYSNYHYKPDWFMHTPEHVYLNGMLDKGVPVTLDNAMIGDIHYFKPGLLSRTKVDRVTHAGIYLGKQWLNGDCFIHSFQNFHGVMVSSLGARAWKTTYGGTVRLNAVIAAIENVR